jgi:hypothetical protein
MRRLGAAAGAKVPTVGADAEGAAAVARHRRRQDATQQIVERVGLRPQSGLDQARKLELRIARQKRVRLRRQRELDRATVARTRAARDERLRLQRGERSRDGAARRAEKVGQRRRRARETIGARQITQGLPLRGIERIGRVADPGQALQPIDEPRGGKRRFGHDC